jgi:hypothetical protein
MSNPVRVAPNAPATVNVGPPSIVRCDFVEKEARCGDTVHIHVTLSTSGFDGLVELHLHENRSGQRLETLRAPVKGNRVVKIKWVCRKPVDVWDGQPDIVFVAHLWSSHVFGLMSGKELSRRDNEWGLTIVRPPNGVWKDLIPRGFMISPAWVAKVRDDWTVKGVINLEKEKQWVRSEKDYRDRCNYDAEFRDGVLTITTRIELRGQNPPRIVEKDGRKKWVAESFKLDGGKLRQWRKQIEGYWNDKYDAHRADCARGKRCKCTFACCRYKVKLRWELSSEEGSGHLVVFVRPGFAKGKWASASWWNSSQWFMELKPPPGDTSGASSFPEYVRAHEAGHSGGQNDDYEQGGQPDWRDPNIHAMPENSIMGHGDPIPTPFHFHEWFKRITYHIGDRLVAVPARTE